MGDITDADTLSRWSLFAHRAFDKGIKTGMVRQKNTDVLADVKTGGGGYYRLDNSTGLIQKIPMNEATPLIVGAGSPKKQGSANKKVNKQIDTADILAGYKKRLNLDKSATLDSVNWNLVKDKGVVYDTSRTSGLIHSRAVASFVRGQKVD